MPPPGVAKITVRTADGKTQEYQLGQQALHIGKDPASEVYIPSRYVSRYHAEILRVGEHFVIQDVGSTNGISVNGRMLRVKEPHSLVSGDRVQLGDVVLTYEEPIVDSFATAIFTLPGETAQSDETAVFSGSGQTPRPQRTTIQPNPQKERATAGADAGRGRTVVGAGTWTILFTDLLGYTVQFSRIGDFAGQRWRRQHDSILRQQFGLYEGLENNYTDSGFLVVFAGARRAVQCAIGIQRELQKYNEGRPELEIHTRIGVHTGEVLIEDNQIFGSAINFAHRVMEQAETDEILISDLLHGLVESAREFAVVDRGVFSLKGFPHPQPIFEVQWQEAEQAASC